MLLRFLIVLLGVIFAFFSAGFAKVTGMGTGWKGKVGNLVFSGWKGEQIVKTRSIPHNPRSAGQVANRSCMSEIVFALKFLAIDVIRPMWHPFTSAKETGWGNCISKNKLAMGQTFDKDKLILSYGSLEQMGDFDATYNDTTGEVVATFDSGVFANGLATDKIGIAVFDSELGKMLGYDLDIAVRSAGTAILFIPSDSKLADLAVIIWAYRVDAEDVVNIASTSQNVTPSASV